MIKIGITGNIACGKSVAFEIIKSEGYPIIDCDDVVKNLYNEREIIVELSKIFPEIIKNDKTDTKKLSELLFSDRKFKADFERFIFPKVKEKIDEFFSRVNQMTPQPPDRIFVIVPLLFEAGFENLFDKIIFISADENIRRERLISRNSRLSDIADKVIKSQTSEEGKVNKCDYVIKNNGTLDEFESAVIKLLNNIS